MWQNRVDSGPIISHPSATPSLLRHKSLQWGRDTSQSIMELSSQVFTRATRDRAEALSCHQVKVNQIKQLVER